jgi:hypothetical protein
MFKVDTSTGSGSMIENLINTTYGAQAQTLLGYMKHAHVSLLYLQHGPNKEPTLSVETTTNTILVDILSWRILTEFLCLKS